MNFASSRLRDPRLPGFLQVFFAATAFIILFKELITRLEIPLGLVDDLVVAMVLGWTVLRATVKRRVSRFDFILIGTAVYLVLISLRGLQPNVWRQIGQVVIHMKFFCLYIFARNLSAGAFRRLWAERIFFALFIFSVIGFVANLILQDTFLAMFNVKFVETSRGGLARIVGFQLKPNDIAFLFSLFYAYIVSKNINRWSFLKSILVSLIFLLLIFLNGSRTALAIFPLVAFLICAERRSARLPIIFFCLAAALPLFASNALDYAITETTKNIGELSRIDQSQYIRAIMVYFGAMLMYQYFPIGAGAATFGSVLSDNSPVYAQLHLLYLPFFEKMEGVYDSNLATVMGEFGFVGVLLFYGILVTIYRDLKRNGDGSAFQNRYWKIVLIFAAFLSITNPFFQYSYNGLIFAIALVIRPHSEKKT
ncbi:hypothetical protein AWB76_06035 [Caballeronia temeraria]|uniref:O-antigen polymerase n=1 Tax=Caballeronia temeraria TaxID=1777137 RepID=A0A158CVH6_9BURK|nr:hypothetical protein [Caballeronia temeraria]SAK86299.1 hypothetical protein AWB76_06035 [Caballeronia temeraria]